MRYVNNNDITVDGAGVGISADSDIENKKINYELNVWYNSKFGTITFTQWKSPKNMMI
ncbi:hypothetical protein CFSAN002368_05928 [Clostridium botulinum A1 str. CFSAN002368]|nr:hypothetical protein CFSAN002368_05928 [Clostridium botulinum A1 str. CFSAN002368]